MLQTPTHQSHVRMRGDKAESLDKKGRKKCRKSRDQADIRWTCHVIIYSRYTPKGVAERVYIKTRHDWIDPKYTPGGVDAGVYRERYIRTLIHVLSLVLRDQFKSYSIGYLLVSDSSALNQQPSIRTRLALFLYSLPLPFLLVDYLTEPGGGDIPINALSTHIGPGQSSKHTRIGRHFW